MKKFNLQVTFVLLFVSMSVSFTACRESKSDDPAPQSLDLIGTWRTVLFNGDSVTTNNRTIITYISSSKKIMSLSQYIPEFDEFTWRNKAMGSYSFDGVNLKQDAADPKTSTISTVTAMDANTMRVNYQSFIDKDSVVTPMDKAETYERVQENFGYEQSIIGLWEGVKHTGEETFGDEHHRWQYNDIDRAGYYTYVYYNFDEATQDWVAAQQYISDYNVHGNWLATRWQSDGDFKMEYEWWDIDYITDTTMQWSALRMKADSTGTFRATFTFRRVQEEE